jgi:hypothetical protein
MVNPKKPGLCVINSLMLGSASTPHMTGKKKILTLDGQFGPVILGGFIDYRSSGPCCMS